MDCQLVLSNIRKIFKNYIINNNLEAVVLGISGGLDSALVAAIVKPICKELNIQFVGIGLPSKSNKQHENYRANLVINAFCSNKRNEMHIDSVVRSFKSILGLAEFVKSTPIRHKIPVGNIKARARMIILYDYAYRLNGIVLGTDNLTEYYLGFWTLHGDVGDLSLIQYLWKSEIYELARYMVSKHEVLGIEKEALQLCIDAVPTDGLGITNSDLDQIGASSYEEVDKILQGYLLYGEHKDHPIVKRYLRTMFKRNNPYNITRNQLFKEEK